MDTAPLSDPDINMRAGSFEPTTWALVYRTPKAMVFVRRVPRFADVIARDEVPLRIHFRWIGGVWVEPLTREEVGSRGDACEWSQRTVRALWKPRNTSER